MFQRSAGLQLQRVHAPVVLRTVPGHLLRQQQGGSRHSSAATVTRALSHAVFFLDSSEQGVRLPLEPQQVRCTATSNPQSSDSDAIPTLPPENLVPVARPAGG